MPDPPMRPLFRALNGLMAALFAFGAAVQYNDPDPLRWIAVYLAAAAVCVLGIFRRPPWPAPALVGAVALLWAATLAPAVLGHVRIGSLFGAWEMKNAAVEEGREMYGLLIVAGWMALLTVIALRRRGSAGEGG